MLAKLKKIRASWEVAVVQIGFGGCTGSAARKRGELRVGFGPPGDHPPIDVGALRYDFPYLNTLNKGHNRADINLFIHRKILNI
jgi:hypothetical protein